LVELARSGTFSFLGILGAKKKISDLIVMIVILLKKSPFILREPQDERRSG
jgi:hypothetical protein